MNSFVVVITVDVTVTANQAKAKLRNCRTTLTKYLRQMKAATGGKGPKKPSWFASAEFLIPHIIITPGIESGVSTLSQMKFLL
jgi:hypothetical protein